MNHLTPGAKEPVFTPKKDYFEREAMHTAEHILNQTMVRFFGCARSATSHIEKLKSKCDYVFPSSPTQSQLDEVEKQVNAVIEKHLPVTARVMPRSEAEKLCDLSKLPPAAGDSLRVVFVGDYDASACIGKHVENTSQIGRFKITTWDWQAGRLRLRFKLEEAKKQ